MTFVSAFAGRHRSDLIKNNAAFNWDSLTSQSEWQNVERRLQLKRWKMRFVKSGMEQEVKHLYENLLTNPLNRLICI